LPSFLVARQEKKVGERGQRPLTVKGGKLIVFF